MAGKKEQGGETGRVHVYARVRPKLEREVGDHTCVEAEEEANKCKVRIQDADAVDKVLSGNSNAVSKVTERDFEFDGVFGESSSQKEVYERVGKPVLRDVTRGYNGCIFAYGQTGSGKTFSLLHAGGQNGSDPSEAGLLPRLAASLFVHIGGDTGSTYKVECAMLQVYNEQVDDLLASGEEGRNLQVLSNSTVKGLRWEECATPDDLLKAFNRGRSNLVYAETQMNKASSRSHAMFQIKVTKRPRATKDSKGQTDSKGSVHMKATFGKLSVVDLAGSERVKRSGAGGQQLKEAANINSSLLTLGNVVQALADKKKHIPIRDSKLTRILEDSIGGNCKTSLLVCCSPAMDSGDETLNSLEFASRAMKVETHAVVNEGTVEVDADKLARDLAGEGLSSAVKEKHNELKQMETKLEEQVRSSQEELQNVKKEAERAKSELAKKTSEKDGEVQRHKEEAKRAQEELAKLQMEVEAKQEEAERVKREMESKVERAHEEAEQKVEEVRKELNVMREEAESAKQELEKERGRFEEERNEEHRKREEAEEALRKETEEVARERDEREEHLKEKAKALERSKQEAEAAAEQRRKELQEAEERARQDLEAKEREAQDNIQAKEQELRQLREDAEKRMAAKEDSMAQERSDLEERLRRTEQEYGDYLARREEDLQNKQRELDEARQAAEETSNQLQETAQKLQEEVKAREQAEVRLEELSSQLQEKEGVAQRAEDGWRAEEERRKQVEESLQEEQELRRCDNEDSEKRRKALAASFAGARRKLELELADAKEASQRLQERLEARESREEDIARIRELEEQQLNEEKRRVEAVEEAEELRRELRNRDTNDAVFGMACKPRFRSTGLNYPRPASRFYSDD